MEIKDIQKITLGKNDILIVRGDFLMKADQEYWLHMLTSLLTEAGYDKKDIHIMITSKNIDFTIIKKEQENIVSDMFKI